MLHYHRIPLAAGKHNSGYQGPFCHPQGAGLTVTFIPLLYPRDLPSKSSFNSHQINYKEQMCLNAQGEYD